MRALGPGSVSSFLKIILDVVFFALWVGAAVLALLALAALLFSFNPDIIGRITISGVGGELVRRGPLMAGALAALALYVGGVLIIVGRLRRIFATLTAGDPFHPENVNRLRLIGVILAGLEVGHYAVAALARVFLSEQVRSVDTGFNPTAWFAVLVIFVLAEVFREGARLRREAELTI